MFSQLIPSPSLSREGNIFYPIRHPSLAKRRVANLRFDGLSCLLINALSPIYNRLSEQTMGFFSHNLLAVDRNSKCCLGWAGVKLYNRPVNNIPFKRPNWSVPIEDKESYKWLGPCITSKMEVLSKSEHVLFVMDREGDIFEVMERLPDESTDVLIRMRHDRKVINDKGLKVKVIDDMKQRKSKGKIEIKITSDCKKRKPRQAKCDIKWASYTIPISNKVYDKKTYRSSIKMTAIQIKERKSSAPPNEKPIEWTLWYSQSVNNIEEALEIIECYHTRWLIEEAHRLLKRKGFNIEATELEKGTSIRKLLLLGMDAATKIMQLKSARDGVSLISLNKVFTNQEVDCLIQLNSKFEGATIKLQNPYPVNSLPWASWIIARLGGWKGFKSQRPPGTITFHRGFEAFQSVYRGYQLLFVKDVYKR